MRSASSNTATDRFTSSWPGPPFKIDQPRMVRSTASGFACGARRPSTLTSSTLRNPVQVGRHKPHRGDKLTTAERIQKVPPMTWDQRDAFLATAAPETRYATLFVVLARRAAGSSVAVPRGGPGRRRAPCPLRFTSERPLEIPQHHRRGVAAGQAADIAARVAAAAAEGETRARNPGGRGAGG